MTPKQIEDRRRIKDVYKEHYSEIYEIKVEMRKAGKQFYSCWFYGYQLIVILTTDGMYAHTIIPCLTYIKEVTKG